MKILLAAEEAAGLQLLRSLLTGPDEIVGVLTSLSNDQSMSTVASHAARAGINLWPAAKVADPEFVSRLPAVDVFLNVHSLYRIHPRLLSFPNIGTFNLHPGPLPRFGGLNAPSWAIYLGEPRHAVTLHWVTNEIDAGPVVYEAAFDLGASDTGLSVSTKCVRAGLPLVHRLLDIAREDAEKIPRNPQPREGRRIFLRNSVPQGGRIDWNRDPEEIVRLIRACDYHPLRSPWGQAWTQLGDQRLEVVRAEALDERADAPPGAVIRCEETGVSVAAAQGTVVLRKVLLDGKAVPANSLLPVGEILN